MKSRPKKAPLPRAPSPVLPDGKISLRAIFSSPYCFAILSLSGILAFFLVPRGLFLSPIHLPLAAVFIATFSLTVSCIAFSAKERFSSLRNSGESFVGALGALAGVVSIELCGISATACSGGIALSALGFLLPAGAIHLLSNFAVPLLALSIAFQIFYLARTCRL